MLGLRVIDLNGNKIGFGKATARHFGKIVLLGSSVPMLFGFFMIEWTKRKQGLHDKVDGCLVVRVNSPSLQSSSVAYQNKSLRVEPSLNVYSNDSDAEFEAEALRRFKAGEITEDAFMQIVKRRQ